MRALFGPLVILGLIVGVWFLMTSRAPAGMTEARYERYQRLPGPKLLYSCTRKPTEAAVIKKARECAQSGRSNCEGNARESSRDDTQTVIEFAGGQGPGSYDELLKRARRNCESNTDALTSGTFKLLESAKK